MFVIILRKRAKYGMIDNVFEKVIHPKNLYQSVYAAAKGKRKSEEVAKFVFRMESEIARLHRELRDGTYRHGTYSVFKIYEPKPRDIAKAPFRDRVVHHAIHDVIEPVIDRSFIFDSYACRVGKGTHVALSRAKSFLCAKKYCLHGDVRKYFPSIDRDILKTLIRRRVGDARLLRLIEEVLESARYVFPGRSGLPIGNLTSQFFANLYLHELDRFVKNDLRCRYYLRYMDDFLLFDDDLKCLLSWKEEVKEMLAKRLNLVLHADKTQIFDTKKGVTFLGFYLAQGRSRVSAGGMRRFRARLKKFRYLSGRGLISEVQMSDSVLCWAAHSRYADASGLRTGIAQETLAWSESVSAAMC